ncbi:MAG: NAD-dependent epimerase/dehydratase family protein [Nitrospiraceae bacterium]|nr:NAD-dependent epimerase/dehydratase family protein [Nitrospiraceae bacterium]
MKVFITGASGYIGFNVARAFRRAGHEVWGLIRNAAKAGRLLKAEISPVLGNMREPESYKPIAETCGVLVHAAMEMGAEAAMLDSLTVDALISTAKKGACPKTFIYTSGCWVYGNTGNVLVDETSPLRPPRLVSWRPQVEQKVLGAKEVRALVLRPGCVYGKGQRLLSSWFSGAVSGSLLVTGGLNRWAMVHVDDLAQGYLRAAESGFSGQIFNLTDQSRWTVQEVVEAIAAAANYKTHINYVQVSDAVSRMGDIAECLALDQNIDSAKARGMLGWVPRHRGFCDEAGLYLHSWQSWKATEEEAGLIAKA